MDRKISILENVSKEIINLFLKKDEYCNKYFSFYFDEENNDAKKIKKYSEFDKIPENKFTHILYFMERKYDFTLDIIKKYSLLVKNIQSIDIDILVLILKSIELQHDILRIKSVNVVKFESNNEYEKFIVDNIYYKLEEYTNLLAKFYINKSIKELIFNIFIFVYNYSVYYSINKLKNYVYVKN
jgi:hypothetical protein